MCGVELPAMSCGNKGNVGMGLHALGISGRGIGAAPKRCSSEALAMSYLTALAVIHRIGKGSSMCSCMVKRPLWGVAAGAVVLKGGSEAPGGGGHPKYHPKWGSSAGVCDGAKPGCALRLSSSTGIALVRPVGLGRCVSLTTNPGGAGRNGGPVS